MQIFTSVFAAREGKDCTDALNEKYRVVHKRGKAAKHGRKQKASSLFFGLFRYEKKERKVNVKEVFVKKTKYFFEISDFFSECFQNYRTFSKKHE